MSATAVVKTTSLKTRQIEKPDWHDREPRMCWRELVQNASDGSYQSDGRLEHLLDRIERLS